jgi:formyl-CoA transferase
VRERGGVQHAGWPGGAYQTKDGHWVAFTAPAQHLFERLCGLLGDPGLARDPRFATTPERSANMAEYLKYVEAWFAARGFDEAVRELEAHQVPYAPIMSMADIFADPHFRERDMIVDVPEPTVGSLPQAGVVPKLSLTPGRIRHAGPPIGQDTDAILQDMLALSPEEIATLRRDGAI